MRMNVYLTTGRKNYKYAYVAIQSLFENNPDAEIYLYIVSEDLVESDLVYEYALAKQHGNHIVILRFDEQVAGKHIQVHADDHWPIGTMSSYWLFHELLPEEVDRILVIESDTVIVGNLSDIYEVDFEGAYAVCPGPEHKPKNHRDFMQKIGGDTLTFVLSMYDVRKIREDFRLEDILAKDEIVKKHAGNSQMEFTFGLLFKDRIKYVPGKTSCIDENERYMQELGYDYIVECEKTAKIIHFSSYKDYSKPWNPVFLVPGYHIWWKYAVKSPYYKEYIERQWKLYDAARERQAEVRKNVSYRNILGCTLALMVLILCTLCLVTDAGLAGMAAVVGAAAGALGASIFVRYLSIKFG